MGSTSVAILGSGNIGTDLMLKILRRSRELEVGAVIGIDPDSDGLAAARKHGLHTCSQGLAAFAESSAFDGIELFFDATSASAHLQHAPILEQAGRPVIDMTPAALGPFVIPPVNVQVHADALNINMVTCGGQATVPIVAAVSAVTDVHYAEIVSSIASRSAGPGTRANIDEFTETTSKALEDIGGARRGKAIIILNPAEPALIMRNTIFMLVATGDESRIVAAVEQMVAEVQEYVPGYRLKQALQFDHDFEETGATIPGHGRFFGTRVAVFLEVEGAADYLPAYAGNLDIMTSAALRAGESLAAARRRPARGAAAGG